MLKKILFVIGTRPEAIKMAPVIWEMQRRRRAFNPIVCLSGQHRELLDQMVKALRLPVDFDLNVMKPQQSLEQLTASLLLVLKQVLSRVRPDMVLVQGDTSTVFVASLAAFYQSIPIAHVEAGLRTFDKFVPFPEEINRRLTSHLADLHFAPTATARHNLLAEGIPPHSIHVTGNTVIDALLAILERSRLESLVPAQFQQRLDLLTADGHRLILVTAHRRESFGRPLERICAAIRKIAEAWPGVNILYPVHMNPRVSQPVRDKLGRLGNVHLIRPLAYPSFVLAMKQSFLILTDSGGVQEEAASLGKPVLVMRDKTERPEVVTAGVGRLVGTSSETIIREVSTLLERPTAYRAMSRKCTAYGDGHAAKRIVRHIEEYLGSRKKRSR